MLKNFIERNKSVFVIGFFTFVIFMAVIIISQVRRLQGINQGPTLIRVEESTQSAENSGVTPFEEAYLVGGTEESAEDVSGSEPEINIYAEQDRKYGTMRVEYNTNGFVPKNAKAILNQKVKFVNATNWEMKIVQKTSFFNEFKSPVVIPAGGFFEFRLTRDGVWTYEEEATKSFGSIIILKP